MSRLFPALLQQLPAALLCAGLLPVFPALAGWPFLDLETDERGVSEYGVAEDRSADLGANPRRLRRPRAGDIVVFTWTPQGERPVRLSWIQDDRCRYLDGTRRDRLEVKFSGEATDLALETLEFDPDGKVWNSRIQYLDVAPGAGAARLAAPFRFAAPRPVGSGQGAEDSPDRPDEPVGPDEGGE